MSSIIVHQRSSPPFVKPGDTILNYFNKLSSSSSREKNLDRFPERDDIREEINRLKGPIDL